MRWLLTAILLVMPSLAIAQARECRIPNRIDAPRAISIPPGERRVTPRDGYLLALSWSPEFCRIRQRDRRHRMQCGGTGNGGAGDFGFILHGLWPEGRGSRYPQWCRPARPLPRSLVRQHLCITPSVQLIQREWAKHGTCATRNAGAYLRASSILYRAIRYPDMNGLSRGRLNVQQFAEVFADANRGISVDMLAVQTNSRGWLTEVRVCLGTNFRPRRCPNHVRRARSRERISIWRGRR